MTWFYADGGQQKGPVSQSELEGLIHLGVVRDDTLVWREGMANWQPYATVKPAPPPPSPDAPPENLLAPGVSGTPTTIGPVGGVVCCECGQRFPAADTAQFGDKYVCEACKPRFVHRLREGAALQSAGSGFVSEQELLARDYPVDISRCLERSWVMFKQNAGLMIGATLVIYLIMFAIGMIPILGYLLPLVLGGPLTAGLALFYIKLTRGEPADFAVVFSGFGPRFVPLMLCQMIVQLLSYACMAPMMIPLILLSLSAGRGGNPGRAFEGWLPLMFVWLPIGFVVIIYLAVSWLFAIRLIADKGYEFWPAMQLSRRVTAKHFWSVLALCIVASVVGMVGALACLMGLIVTGPLATGMLAWLYQDIFGDLAPAKT